MRGALAATAFGLALVSCASQTEEAISLAYQAKRCHDLEQVRQELWAVGDQMTEAEIDKAIELNRMGTLLCSTTISQVVNELEGLIE